MDKIREGNIDDLVPILGKVNIKQEPDVTPGYLRVRFLDRKHWEVKHKNLPANLTVYIKHYPQDGMKQVLLPNTIVQLPNLGIAFKPHHDNNSLGTQTQGLALDGGTPETSLYLPGASFHFASDDDDDDDEEDDGITIGKWYKIEVTESVLIADKHSKYLEEGRNTHPFKRHWKNL